jgi:hypothetical protein
MTYRKKVTIAIVAIAIIYILRSRMRTSVMDENLNVNTKN